MGGRARRERALAQLRRLRRGAAHLRGRAALAPRGALRAAPPRPVLPDRPAAELQREVPAGVAAALPLRRAGTRLPDRGPRVPARRVAADAARPVGGRPRPDHRVRLVAAAAVLTLLAA